MMLLMSSFTSTQACKCVVQLPQSLASRQRHSSQEPDDITVVKVEQSLTNPNIERVQVSQKPIFADCC